MTMVGSTARPGVRRGDVSEEPRRCLLIAVLVAALVPLTHADCSATDDPRCSCEEGWLGRIIYCDLHGDYSQVPSFRQSNTVYGHTHIYGKWTSLTVQTGTFKNLKTKSILIYSRNNITIEPGAFSCVGGERRQLLITSTLIPEGAFDGLGQLKHLYLERNRMKTVDRLTFSHLPNLTMLLLSSNQVEAIHDEAFDGLSQIKVLELDKNHLKTVSHRMFSKLSHLERLTLTQNQLETLPYDAFDGLSQLTYLLLSTNGLKTVIHSMFSHLSRLEKLDLDHNQLETIPDDSFLRLGQLKYLQLNNNQLTSLNVTLVSSMSQLYGIVLFDNPLTCDCRLAWIQAKEKGVYVYGMCANPPSARSKSVTAYDVSQCKQDTTNTGIVSIDVFKLNFKPLHFFI